MAPQVTFAEEPERKRRGEGPKGKGGGCGGNLLTSNVTHSRPKYVENLCGKHLESMWVIQGPLDFGSQKPRSRHEIMQAEST